LLVINIEAWKRRGRVERGRRKVARDGGARSDNKLLVFWAGALLPTKKFFELIATVNNCMVPVAPDTMNS
jgi:hypothetical protein